MKEQLEFLVLVFGGLTWLICFFMGIACAILRKPRGVLIFGTISVVTLGFHEFIVSRNMCFGLTCGVDCWGSVGGREGCFWSALDSGVGYGALASVIFVWLPYWVAKRRR